MWGRKSRLPISSWFRGLTIEKKVFWVFVFFQKKMGACYVIHAVLQFKMFCSVRTGTTFPVSSHQYESIMHCYFRVLDAGKWLLSSLAAEWWSQNSALGLLHQDDKHSPWFSCCFQKVNEAFLGCNGMWLGLFSSLSLVSYFIFSLPKRQRSSLLAVLGGQEVRASLAWCMGGMWFGGQESWTLPTLVPSHLTVGLLWAPFIQHQGAVLLGICGLCRLVGRMGLGSRVSLIYLWLFRSLGSVWDLRSQEDCWINDWTCEWSECWPLSKDP